MAIKNFLFTLTDNFSKVIPVKTTGKLIFVLAFFLAGCQGFGTREQHPTAPPPALTPSPQENSETEMIPPVSMPPQEELPPPKVEAGQTAKVGIILGPGGIRSFAEIGVLQELVKSKIPIQSIAGIEMGSLVAASFAHKGQVFDVEWQMMKMKEDDLIRKGLIGGAQANDARSLNGFLQNVFGSSKAEDAKVNFSCPSWNLASHQAYMMTRGPYVSMLPYCLSLYPLLRPYNQNIAGVGSLSTLVKNMRAKGINYLIYVSIMEDKGGSVFGSVDSVENTSWNIVEQSLQSQFGQFNYVIRVPLQQYSITDFSKRRELLQKGQEIGHTAAQLIAEQLGL